MPRRTIKQRLADEKKYARRFKDPAFKLHGNAVTERLRVTSINGPAWNRVRFSLSADMVDELVRLHDRKWRAFIYDPDMARRYRNLKVQLIRMVDIPIAGVVMRICPPAQKGGRRLRRMLGAAQYYVDVAAHKVGLHDAIVTRDLEVLWSEQMEGLIAMFVDSDCIFPSARAIAWKEEHHPGAELLVL